MSERMKIGIVGTGVSGLVAAYVLSRKYDITVYEASDTLGGHANTIDVQDRGKALAVDTGFVVFNEQAYPHFVRLLKQLGVASQPSDMSFSLQCASTGLEYASHSLDGLFAQRRNVLKPKFFRMLMDMRRFFSESKEVLQNGHSRLTLGEYLRERRYSKAFVEQHLIPMGSAIWSADPRRLQDFPVRRFVQFFDNHGFLQVTRRPEWRTITGGSRKYVEALSARFRDRVRLKSPVERVRRLDGEVEVSTRCGGPERFDRLVIATHSDQALSMLADPSDDERRVLGAIPYQPNETVLHTDANLLPRRRRAWASWNYHKPANARDAVSITYSMNRLQSLSSSDPLCVTLNRSADMRPEKVVRRMTYHHPVFDQHGFAAQENHHRISGVRSTYYCGAYWGYGFHEDGVRSALRVCAQFGLDL